MSNTNLLGSFGSPTGDAVVYDKAVRTVTHPSNVIDASLSDNFIYNCNSFAGVKNINISNLSDFKNLTIQVINNASGEIRFALSNVLLTAYLDASVAAVSVLTSGIFKFSRIGNNVYITAINPSSFSVLSYVSGYFGGGSNNLGTALIEIDGIRFSTDTAINPAATLAVARSGLAGVQSGGIL
jgi:hypothetical protein